MKIVKFRKFISSILIIQLIVPIIYLPTFNPNLVSDDYISDEPSWTKVWKENHSWVSSIAINSFNDIYTLRGMYNPDTDVRQYFLTELNNSGVLELEVPIGYIDNYCFYHTIKIDAYNNIYIAGYYDSQEDGKEYMILLRYDIMGNQIWNRTWGGFELFQSYDMDIDVLGNIYLVGSVEINQLNNYDMYLVKFNSSGVMLWNQTWGREKYDEYKAVATDSNGNVYAIGSYNYYPVLMKYNSSGTYECNYTWNEFYYASDLIIDYNGDIVVAIDNLLIKLKADGTPLWNFTISEFFSFPKLLSDSLNNIYIAENRYLPCYDNSFFMESSCICTSIYLEKVSSSGFFLWKKRCTGCGSARYSDLAADFIGNIYLSGELSTEFGCIRPLFDAILMKNPKNFEGGCIEIYYDLLFLIAVPIAINMLIVIIIFIKRNRRKRTGINS